MTTALTLTHLRFDCVARTPVKLGLHQAGERLRNALAWVILQAVCPETARAVSPTHEHAAACPACWLLAANLDPGVVRRAYSMAPPLPPQDVIPPGGRFSFTLTLFGQGYQYLPYFVLAVPEMGRAGVGPGRGQFTLESIWAPDPWTGKAETVLRPGEQVVRPPLRRLGWEEACRAAESWLPALGPNTSLRVRFLTPTRLIEGDARLKSPDFAVFFQRLLLRIDQVAQQFAGEAKRPQEDVRRLHGLADRVRLMDASVEWVDLFSYSGRSGRSTPMGGFTGWAIYRSPDWAPLLPWLLLGQGVQAGRLTVKGNGVYTLQVPGVPDYWRQVYAPFELLQAGPAG